MDPKQIPYHLAESPDGGEQRWKHGRTRFVPPADLFDPKRASVVPLDEGDAKVLVCAHHFAHSYPPARFRAGLTLLDRFGVERLVGVAVFGVNIQQKASMRKYLGPWRQLHFRFALPHLKCYFAGPIASPKLLPPELAGGANEEAIEQGGSSGSGVGCQGAIPAGQWT